MKKLFEKIEETQPLIDKSVKEIVDFVKKDINEGEYNLNEMNALISVIQAELSNKMAYELATSIQYKATDFK